MSQYCLVENEEIIERLMELPTSWRNISGLPHLNTVELAELGWLPYIDIEPEYNTDTQYLTHETVIGEDAVTETYTVNDYSAEELATRFATEQTLKLSDLYANVKQFISYQSNGWPRYDNDLKLNVMNVSMIAVAAGNPKPENCVLVETWIYTVQQEFFTLKSAINEAVDLTTLRAIDVSLDYFEDKYGRQGLTLADPAISTDDLFI